MRGFEKPLAGFLALLALGAVLAQVRVNMLEDGNSPGQAVWAMYRYFTIWTITLCGIALLRRALGKPVAQSLMGCLAMAIIVVGVVYHILLAATHEVAGIEVFLNLVFHTIIPIGFPLFWLIYSPKDALTWRTPVTWLIYPLVYCLYALVRGMLDGEYPYFFLDVGKQGWGGVALYILGLSIFIIGVSFLVLSAGRLSKHS